ncbi:META domain-containing protein [Cellulomonas sp. zg-ZUI222]|uniref:META domain-containing protein n=1 Tax=Cellulomonas wangleii TaxID=2816956 RepID=A0ABX8D5L5_9CELL|nr:META domain-containing protein [Cellulomonas wangleii]MBO0920172.1 META domain-containing protein [Cellulomonas wangleii]MBO0923401.1 META domain-containing protein [Cellulomonas wangleii]QVI61751.1 META domain-containing protein [Cellulomonas wangleii]
MARTTGRGHGPATAGRTARRGGRPRAGRARRTPATALLVGALLLVAACTTGTEPTGGTTTDGGSTATGTPGTGDRTDGAWALTSGEVDGAALTVTGGAPVTLLVEDGRVSGTSGCNTYTGAVDTTDGWSVGDVGLTRMACEPAVMALETAYLDALARVDAAELTDDGLELTGPDVVLTFVADPNAA